MKLRTVRILQYARSISMGGIPVRQALPAFQTEQVDPFLLLHHLKSSLEPGLRPGDAGVGPHPHRGFSPVTFVIEGDVHHRDSRGNSEIVQAGGVQWMDAGMGLIHSERPSKALLEKGGLQEVIQIWVNTPHAHKLDQPEYQAIRQASIPALKLPERKGQISVIAGDFETLHGPAKTKLDLLMLRCDFAEGTSYAFEVQEDWNLLVYVLNGSVEIKGYGTVPGLNMAVFNRDGEGVEITAHQKTTFLLLAGKPLDEKVESYGPFVMTSQTEILEAIRDYQKGKMGVLIEEFK